jgi:hypothetical protein
MEKLVCNKEIDYISKQNLPMFVYDTFKQKYGLTNVAENKFIGLCASVMLYADNLRIALFGRFMNIWEKLD